MIDIFSLNNIFLFLITFGGLIIAFWVYLSNPKERINQLFLLFTIFNLLWIIFTRLSDISNLPEQTNLAILFRNLAYGSVFLFFISVYFFIKKFFKIQRNKILDGAFLSLGFILFFITVFTKFIVKNIKPSVWGNYPVFGEGASFAYGTIIFLTILILGTVIRRYLSLSEKEKLKAQYFLLGTFIFALGNFIFNIILVPKWSSFPYYYIGNYSAIFLLSFTAYAIVKKELFGIKVILTELLIGAIGLILLVQIFIAPTSASRILNGSIFILFVVFAYYLIKATFEESKRREEAEKIAIRESALRKKAEKLTTAFKRLDEAKTQFMLATQHHLRTPLTSIQGYLSMLYEGSWGEINPVAKSKIRGALESTQKLIRLVNELLDIAKLEVGKEIITKRETQIEEILQEVINELEPQAKEKGIFLKFEKPESLPKIMVDPEKIKESIYNLILNGINYTLKGGVTLKLEEKEGKSILISFKDTGIGMKEEEIENLFERIFERGKRAKKLYTTGRGIGLYLASQIIKAHQGKIWAESSGPGKGSTFYIELPMR